MSCVSCKAPGGAARSIEQSVHAEVRTTEAQLDAIPAEATESAPAAPDAEAPPVVAAAPPVTAPAAAPGSPQLELGLDAAGEAPRKQA